MVKQLQYSSVEHGLSGHPGLQFVAVSSSVSEEEKRLVLPHMTYRPPPDAGARPTAADIAAFPVGLGYARHGGRSVIAQTRYLGKDYSGRYGNFLAHALIIDGDELEGIRPIELWRSAVWPSSISADETLSELADIRPNPELNPDMIARYLESRGPDSYLRLGYLLDAVRESLAQNAGRIIVTAVDTDDIAMWIAAVFYSLPQDGVDELSFLSYTADPDGAQYRLVGTSPAVWSSARPRGRVFHLDGTVDELESAHSRFAEVVVAAWRARDLEAIDTLIEMAEATGDADRAATLTAFSNGSTLRPGEPVVVAEALDRLREDLPESTWRGIDDALPAAGVEVATAVHEAATRRGRESSRINAAQAMVDGISRAAELPRLVQLLGDAARAGIPVPKGVARQVARTCVFRTEGDLRKCYAECPERFRAELLAGAVDGIAELPSRVRERVLTGELCAWLLQVRAPLGSRLESVVWESAVEHDPQWRRHAIDRLARRHRGSALSTTELTTGIARLWEGSVPSPQDCRALLDAIAADTPCPPEIFDLLGQALKADPVDIEASARLAESVIQLSRTAEYGYQGTGPATRILADAELVLSLRDALSALLDGTDPASAIDAVAARRHAVSQDLFVHAVRRLAQGFGPYDAPDLVHLLTNAESALRRDLVGHWVSLPGSMIHPYTVAETIIRLYRNGEVSPAFKHYLWELFDSRSARNKCARYLSRQGPGLVAEFNELLSGRRAPAGQQSSIIQRTFHRER
ncbi:hypothetical protein ACFWFQ_20620 [Nocardia salmonicida]|uniref:GAP1-N2 domain-containing protein n=1 Tax=Nocardia salmonicida TaxID=53431 RepID=UPI00365182E0